MARYAILDSSQRGGFHKRLDRYGVQYRSLFMGHAEENLLEIAPLLINLAETSAVGRAVQEIEQLAATRPAVSLLESDLDFDVLANHLRAFHTVRLAGQKEMILRWYDTRILPVWMEVMTDSQRAGFLHGIDRWAYYDRFGDIRMLEWDTHAPKLPLAPYALDERQLDRLQVASEPDGLLLQLRRVIPDEISLVSSRQLHAFVEQHLEIARQHGLGDLDERVQFLLLALFTGGVYLETEDVSRRLSRPCCEQPVAFQDWIDALPNTVWHAGQPLWSNAPVAMESA